AFVCCDVEAGHPPTGCDQIAGECAAHDAEPDHAHGLAAFRRAHSKLSLISVRRTLAQDSKRWEPVSGKGHFVTGRDRLSSTATPWFREDDYARQSIVGLYGACGRDDRVDGVAGICARFDHQEASVG